MTLPERQQPTTIETYLDAIDAQLPGGGSRLLDEIRAHLEDAATRYEGDGLSAEEAQARAVADLGAPDEIASAVEREGGPVFSPTALKVIPWLASLCALPMLIFLWATAIEHLAGNAGGVGIFGYAFDRHRETVNLLILVGPPVGLLLSISSGTRIRPPGENTSALARVRLRLPRTAIVVAITCAALSIGTAAYLVTQGGLCIPGWRPGC